MAAVTTHLESQDPIDDTDTSCEIQPDGTLGARACVPPIESQHNGLVKTLWIRRSLEDVLAQKRYAIMDGNSLAASGLSLIDTGDDDVDAAKTPSLKKRTKLYIVLDKPLMQYDIPWMVGAQVEAQTFSLIGSNSKMKCPTWDLPAGATMTGGSCPGATPGQTTVPHAERVKAANRVHLQVRIQETICGLCYATGGQYASPHVQGGEILRFWWTKELMQTGRSAEWVATMKRAFEGETWARERLPDPRPQFAHRAVLPVRVHSSGDFFSVEYAKAWIDLCNQLPELLFWAPTRTWASPGWNEIWAGLLPQLQHQNLILRPSAYHTNEAAPVPESHPWPGGFPYTADGSASFYKFVQPGPHDFEFQCGTYAAEKGSKNCLSARAPDGHVGCRACWVHPTLSINYTSH